jgi:hypothetical protein
MGFFEELSEQVLVGGSLYEALLNVLLTLVFGQLLAWHYGRYARVLGDRKSFSGLLVQLSVTTLLVIMVVKTSLALSLGLVGALSIIRFRTPVKEPEDLVYLFLAIALGIGVGAGRQLVTVAILSVVLLYVAAARRKSVQGGDLRALVQVAVPLDESSEPAEGERALNGLVEAVRAGGASIFVRRVDRAPARLCVSLLVDLATVSDLGAVMTNIERGFPGAEVSVIDRDSFE